MKKIYFSLLLFSTFSGSAQVDVKSFAKNYVQLDSKNPFKKSDKICFMGLNLTLKTADLQRKGSLNKSNKWGVDRLVTVLDGLTENDMYELADEVKKRFEERFKRVGYTIVEPESLKNEDAYNDLLKNTTAIKKGEFFKQLESGHEWGVAATYPAGGRPIFKFPKTQMGSHAKLAKKSDAIICNFSLLIEPIMVNWDKKYKSGDNVSQTYDHNFGFDNLIRISHFSNILTYDLPEDIVSPDWGSFQFKDVIFDDNQKISAKTDDYIVSVKKGMPSGGSGPQWADFSYTVTVDPVKFKAAVLKAMDVYIENLAAYAEDRRK